MKKKMKMKIGKLLKTIKISYIFLGIVLGASILNGCGSTKTVNNVSVAKETSTEKYELVTDNNNKRKVINIKVVNLKNYGDENRITVIRETDDAGLIDSFEVNKKGSYEVKDKILSDTIEYSIVARSIGKYFKFKVEPNKIADIKVDYKNKKITYDGEVTLDSELPTK